MKSRHTFIVTLEVDSAKPIAQEQLARAIAYRISDGTFIESLEVLPVTVIEPKEVQ